MQLSVAWQIYLSRAIKDEGKWLRYGSSQRETRLRSSRQPLSLESSIEDVDELSRPRGG